MTPVSMLSPVLCSTLGLAHGLHTGAQLGPAKKKLPGWQGRQLGSECREEGMQSLQLRAKAYTKYRLFEVTWGISHGGPKCQRWQELYKSSSPTPYLKIIIELLKNFYC